MPHIDVSLYPGRSSEVKKELARRIVDFFSADLGFPAETLSVSLTEIEKEKFAEEMSKRIDSGNLVIASEFVK